MLDFLIPLYYAGLFACGAQGYNNTHGNWSKSVIFFAAFGGGVVRDGAILHRPLAVLSPEAIPEVCTAWLGAMFQALYPQKRFLTIFLSLADWFGLATFFVIGASVAQSHGCGPIMAWICGVVTSLGGGVLSGRLSGLPLRNILSQNITYRCIVMVAGVLYVFWLYTSASLLAAQSAVVLFTGVGNLVLSKWFQNLLRHFVQKQISLIGSLEYAMDLIFLPPYLWQKGADVPYQAPKVNTSYQRPWFRPPYHFMQPT